MEDLEKTTETNIMNKSINIDEQDYHLVLKFYNQIFNKKSP